MGNTVILFVRRYKSNAEKSAPVKVVAVSIDNVGFDSTGRARSGSQLEAVAKQLRLAKKGIITSKCVRLLPEISKSSSIASLPDLLSGRLTSSISKNTIPLSDIVEVACNGRTPSRASYSAEGLFLLKVGNLTGQGINWEARARNFISGPEVNKRATNPRLILKQDDIVLTSSAHSPVYIAKKVDIVGNVPDWVGGRASFVGEVMMLRLRKGVDPFALLAYLRLPSTLQQIQALIRGQTAHLHPKDFLDMHVPPVLAEPPRELRELADRIKAEAKLSEKLNLLRFEERNSFTAVENALLP